MSGQRRRLAPQPAGVDHYAVLGVSPLATVAQIKAAYRALVKLHHPDLGGDAQRILALNAAWEALRDGPRRRSYDASCGVNEPGTSEAGPVPDASSPGRPRRQRGAASDEQLLVWLQQVYGPIDRLLAQVINPFPAQLRALSADPYDDRLMAEFCAFLEQGQARLEKVVALYRSMACPRSAQGFGLSLYHCLSQVQDALGELERYTMGYVDSYLHDGREMLREAKRRRSLLQEERRRLEL
ncbi:MAG: DnaJ domain-containing protein [Synechococcaceae cyanobacterium ELA263]